MGTTVNWREEWLCSLARGKQFSPLQLSLLLLLLLLLFPVNADDRESSIVFNTESAEAEGEVEVAEEAIPETEPEPQGGDGTTGFVSSLQWQDQNSNRPGTEGASDDSDDEFERELEDLRREAREGQAQADANDFFSEREGAQESELDLFNMERNEDESEDLFGDFSKADPSAKLDLFEGSASGGDAPKSTNHVDLLSLGGGLSNGVADMCTSDRPKDDMGVDLLNLSPTASRDSQNVDLFSGTEKGARGMRRNKSADDILNPPHEDHMFKQLGSHSSGCSAENLASFTDGQVRSDEFDPFGIKRESASSPDLFDPFGPKVTLNEQSFDPFGTKSSNQSSEKFDPFGTRSSGSNSSATLDPFGVNTAQNTKDTRSSGSRSSPTFYSFDDKAADSSKGTQPSGSNSSTSFDPFGGHSTESASGTHSSSSGSSPTFDLFAGKTAAESLKGNDAFDPFASKSGGSTKSGAAFDMFGAAPAQVKSTDLLGGWGGRDTEPVFAAESTLQPQKAPSPAPTAPPTQGRAPSSGRGQGKRNAHDPFADLGNLGTAMPTTSKSPAAPRFQSTSGSPTSQRKATSSTAWTRPAAQPSRQSPKAPSSPSQSRTKPNYTPMYSSGGAGSSVFGAYGLKTNYGKSVESPTPTPLMGLAN